MFWLCSARNIRSRFVPVLFLLCSRFVPVTRNVSETFHETFHFCSRFVLGLFWGENGSGTEGEQGVNKDPLDPPKRDPLLPKQEPPYPQNKHPLHPKKNSPLPVNQSRNPIFIA
jgi:hypothetical protein